jgi:hemoglobin-like flavoprotein
MGGSSIEAAAAIHRSLELAALVEGDLTARVYAELFTRAPEIAPKFDFDKSGAVKGEMLAKAFDAILDLVGPNLYAATLLHAEAINHDSFGISSEIFASFIPVIAAVIARDLGDDWTPEMAHAWDRLGHQIAALILRANS